jgi:hypothetical protein
VKTHGSTKHERKHDRRFRKGIPAVAVAAALMASAPSAALAGSLASTNHGTPVAKQTRQQAVLTDQTPSHPDLPQGTSAPR